MSRYTEFNLHEALIGGHKTSGNQKIQGVNEVMKIYSSKDSSTEAFIEGSLRNFGDANNCLLFANKSLENLQNKLKLVAQVTSKVVEAKNRGQESFQNVTIVDPWEMSIEGKVGDFFKKVWAAILSAIRRVIVAFANLVKYVKNSIAGAAGKARAKDYEEYSKNATLKAAVDKAVTEKSKTGGITTLPWKFASINELEKIITGISSVLITMNGTASSKKADEIFAKVSKSDLKAVKTPEDMDTFMSKTFGGIDKFKETVESIRKEIGDELEKNKSMISGGKKAPGATASSKALVNQHFFGSNETPKAASMKFSDLKTKSGNFAILGVAWSGTNIKKMLVASEKAENNLTQLTSKLDAVAKKFESVNADTNNGKLSSTNSMVSMLAKERVQYSTFFSGVMADTIAMVFRFQHAAHRALSVCLTEAKKATKKADKAKKEGAESVDAFDLNFLSNL